MASTAVRTCVWPVWAFSREACASPEAAFTLFETFSTLDTRDVIASLVWRKLNFWASTPSPISATRRAICRKSAPSSEVACLALCATSRTWPMTCSRSAAASRSLPLSSSRSPPSPSTFSCSFSYKRRIFSSSDCASTSFCPVSAFFLAQQKARRTHSARARTPNARLAVIPAYWVFSFVNINETNAASRKTPTAMNSQAFTKPPYLLRPETIRHDFIIL